MTRDPLDVVIVSYNRSDLLVACCQSVTAADPAARIVVVDNASTDDSAAAVRRAYASAAVLESDVNVGFATAVNRGAEHGAAPLLLLLNSDARIDAEALSALRAELLQHDAVAAVGPRLRDSDGTLELSVGRTMGPVNEVWFKLLGLLHGNGRFVTRWLERRYRRAADVRSLSAACLLIRRSAFEAVGGMDEQFFLYGEDVDLCRRLVAAGWRLRYTPDATVRHIRGASAGQDPGAAELAYRRSQLALYRKHHGWLAIVLLRLRLAARYLLRWMLAGGPDRERARILLRWCLHPDATDKL